MKDLVDPVDPEVTDPKLLELVRLARLVIVTNGCGGNLEFRRGELSVFWTFMGITIRLFQPANQDRTPTHDLVYATGTWDIGWSRDPFDGYRTMSYDETLSDRALELLRKAVVLDLLADV